MSFPEFDRTSQRHVANGPQVRPLSKPDRGGLYRRLFKRALDTGTVILASPFVVPIVAGLAIAVAANGGSPFYSQTRIGKGGVPFRIWKLRSMVIDADAAIACHLAGDAAARTEWDATQKLKCDPRITPLGRFLRRASLDELPQLWNVLKGDMSLVGPRPMMPSQQPLYPGQGYYSLRPGITGPWQTSDRNRSTFEARAGFDDAYEADLSLMTDLRLLGRTVGVVVKCTGY